MQAHENPMETRNRGVKPGEERVCTKLKAINRHAHELRGADYDANEEVTN